MIKIMSNGGGAPQPLESLLQRLETDALDRSFLSFSDCSYVFMEKERGGWRFWGNFLTYSHLFDVWTDEPDVAKSLAVAIRDNLRRHRWSDPEHPPGDHRARELQRRHTRKAAMVAELQENSWRSGA